MLHMVYHMDWQIRGLPSKCPKCCALKMHISKKVHNSKCRKCCALKMHISKKLHNSKYPKCCALKINISKKVHNFKCLKCTIPSLRCKNSLSRKWPNCQPLWYWANKLRECMIYYYKYALGTVQYIHDATWARQRGNQSHHLTTV